VIRTATTNLLLRSEEFDNASWAKGDVTVQENAALAPNGSTLADKLIASATTAVHNISQAVTASSAAHTFSIYLKAAELTTVSIRAGRSGNFVNADINLSLGTIASPTTSGTATNVSSSIQSVSNDWYRCSVTGSNLGDGQIAPVIYIPDDASLPGDGTSGIYLWGAQLEQSTTVGEYIPTTSTINSAPRFDHDPTTGESLGLLVEEQRTNLLLRSEEFDTTWTPTRASVTANTTLAPNGTATADSLIEDSTASASHFLSQTVTFAAGSYTFFCYLKANTRSEARLICFDNTTTFAVYFDMSTGTVGSTAGGAAGSISLMADGWYRCSITFTAAAGTGYARVGLAVAGSQTYTGDGTSGIYIWGAQLEAGAFPTSYIPTSGTTATRAADVASISGSNFSSWYRQDEGTYSDWTAASNGSRSFHMEDASRTNGERFGHRVISNYASAEVASNGVYTSVNGTSAGTISAYPTRIKSCVGYDSSSAVVAFRGAVNSTATATMARRSRAKC
jgi:hypothetical protein